MKWHKGCDHQLQHLYDELEDDVLEHNEKKKEEEGEGEGAWSSLQQRKGRNTGTNLTNGSRDREESPSYSVPNRGGKVCDAGWLTSFLVTCFSGFCSCCFRKKVLDPCEP